MKILLLLSSLFLSMHLHAQIKNVTKDSIKSTTKIENTPNNNFFENGVTPTTFRYFYPEVNENGYSMIVYQTEGMDGINYFGNRLTDRNLDGRIDIIQRIQEQLVDAWDFPSTEPRPFIRIEIENDFSSRLFKDTTLVFSSVDHKYFEDESGAYYYNFAWFDPTRVNEIGMSEWKDFFNKNGLVENVDYGLGDLGDLGLILEFTPRIYRKKNGKIEDVTSTHLKYSDEILGTRARFPWDQSLGLGDLDGDGDTDILMSGIPQVPTTQSSLPEYDSRVISIFYYFKHDGNGKLFGEIYDFEVDGNYRWLVPEATNQYATQMDNDASEELLSELWIDIVGDQNSIPIRKFGHFNLNHTNKRVEFVPIFSSKDYLLDTAWNIFPKIYHPMSFLNTQKELILYFFTGPSGSPSKEYTGVNLDNSTGSDFNKGVVQQYFRIYEKKKEGNDYKLIDVTKDYFFEGEYETFSLDNSGTIHLIDVDNDGKLDIYPQIGSIPYTVKGGINQFLKYPAWNGKTNTLYYFKQVENNKFKLTDLAKINGFYYPNNLKSGYSVFDSNGIYRNNETDFRFESFTLQNNASLNDLDGDGKLEIISSSNPSYLHVFTKSALEKNQAFEKLKISPQLKIEINNLNEINRYDFSKVSLSSDTLYKFLDETISQQFVIIDSLKRMTHYPSFFEAHPKESTFYIHPPRNIVKGKIGGENIYQFPMQIPRTSVDGKPVNQMFIGGYYTRIDNDLEMRTKEFFYSSKNLAPLPFEELTSKISQNSDLKGFEVEISISFDLNQNHHLINNQRINGLKYGYEIYLGDTLLKRELFPNVNYKTYDNGAKTKIYGLNILTGNFDLEKIDYKIFALDSFDETIRTYGTMLDRKGPVLITKSNITAKLDDKGGYELKIEQVDDGSTDNVGITEFSLSKTSFTCSDLGTSKVTFTAKDASGNTSSAEVTVTVVDEIKPTPKTKNTYTIKLDVEGKATLKWEDIDEGSSDNCSITERKLSKTEFSRTDGGDNKVTYTIIDSSGNTSSIDLTVRVDIVLSAPERASESNTVKAYPNPVDDYLYLEFAEGISYGSIRTSSLVDASGKVLGELSLEDAGNGRLGFSTRNLKTGMYFLRLSTRDTLHLIKFTVIH